MTILDLGGRPEIWESVPNPLDITFLNLPGATGQEVKTHHRARFIEGDGCDVGQFAPQSFDLVFSNSVIEHVGPPLRQQLFAREVQRLGKGYWVQTPSKWFPIEAHTGMPFWWFYPDRVRGAFLKRWRRRLPGWSRSMADTRVLSAGELYSLFPESSLWVERWFGVPKSYAVYRIQGARW